MLFDTTNKDEQTNLMVETRIWKEGFQFLYNLNHPLSLLPLHQVLMPQRNT